MNSLEPTVRLFCLHLCETLFHSLWQVLLLALAARYLVVLMNRRYTENTTSQQFVDSNYAMHVAAMVLSVAAIPVTWAWVASSPVPIAIEGFASTIVSDDSQAEKLAIPRGVEVDSLQQSSDESVSRKIPRQSAGDSRRLAGGGIAGTEQTPSRPVSSPSQSDGPTWFTIIPWIATCYIAGVAFFLLRLFVMTARAQRLRAKATQINDGHAFEILQQLRQRWSMKAVPLLSNVEGIIIPHVTGLLRPVILFPASTLTSIPIGDLELILVHELAHIRRFDLWVNLVQRLAEIVLFFNPAAWYLSRRVTTLREYCCDELCCGVAALTHADAVSHEEPRLRYANALVRMAERSQPSARASLATLAVTGQSPSELRRRIARLLGLPLPEPGLSYGSLFAVLGLAALMILPAVAQSQIAGESSKTAPNAIGATSERSFALQVVGPDGKPVPNAEIQFRTSPKIKNGDVLTGSFVESKKFGNAVVADDDGLVRVRLKSPPTRFHVFIRATGFGPYVARWNAADNPASIPNEFTAELESAWSMGGQIVDKSGKPIEAAIVRPSIELKKGGTDLEQLGAGAIATTDGNGRWRFDGVPESMQDVWISVGHPDYKPHRQRHSRTSLELRNDSTRLSQISLEHGLTISGTVTDDQGNPIDGALIRAKFFNELRTATTDESGRYLLIGCEPRMTRVVASAQGKAMELQTVQVDSDMKPLDFLLQPGGHVRVRVVDENGTAIPKARIFLQRWRGHVDYFEFDHINGYADNEGIWEWDEAPRDEFQVDICRPHGMQLTYQPIVARDEEYVFTPPETLTVSGQVIDATTKEPVTNFRAVSGENRTDISAGTSWETGQAFRTPEGTYQVQFNRTAISHLVRIEAGGYSVFESRKFLSTEGRIKYDIELQPAEDVELSITTPTGAPALGAKAALGIEGSQIQIKNGEFNDSSTFATRFVADQDGRIRFPARNDPYDVVITHAAGFAHLQSSDGPVSGKVELTAWARVEGAFKVGNAVAANIELNLQSDCVHNWGEQARISTQHNVATDANGRFVFERVFPGQGSVGRNILLMVDDGATEVTSCVRMATLFKAGETTTLDLGGTGHAVTGKLLPPERYKDKVHWSFALVRVFPAPGPVPPSAPADVQDDNSAYEQWWNQWIETTAGKAWRAEYAAYEKKIETLPVYTMATVDKDGSFRIDDLPAGEYSMTVRFSQYAPGGINEYLFAVPPIETGTLGHSPFELPPLRLE